MLNGPRADTTGSVMSALESLPPSESRPPASSFEVLERSDAYRAELIGRLDAWDDGAWLAELLMDLEKDVGEIARLRLVDELRRTVGEKK